VLKEVKKTSLKKRPFVAVFTGLFFIFSLVQVPLIAEAATPQVTPETQNTIQNPLAAKVDIKPLSIENFKLIKQTSTSYTKLEIDPNDMSRIYSITEIHDGKAMTLRYLYDDVYETVTVLLSIVDEAKQPEFDYYYRYALGRNNSLELILEEGWITKSNMMPSRFYDYYPHGVQVRFFDKTGKILKIDSSDGFTKKFIYSRSGKLLTIQETDPLGTITFYDQLLASLKEVAPESPAAEKKSIFYTLPTRENEKRLEPAAFKNPDLDLGLNHSKGHLIPFKADGRFLEWLVAAHPSRAGPIMEGGRVL
jgi:hypothetical protein